MGADSECDLVVEATNGAERARITAIRNRPSNSSAAPVSGRTTANGSQPATSGRPSASSTASAAAASSAAGHHHHGTVSRSAYERAAAVVRPEGSGVTLEGYGAPGTPGHGRMAG